MSTNEELEARVEKGIACLNEEVPGWYNMIDLDQFNIGESCNCVLGQLFGSYPKGIRVLQLSDKIGNTVFGRIDGPEACQYGFHLHESDLFGLNIWGRLNLVWIRRIMELQYNNKTGTIGESAQKTNHLLGDNLSSLAVEPNTSASVVCSNLIGINQS